MIKFANKKGKSMVKLHFCFECGKQVYRDDYQSVNPVSNLYCEDCKQKNGF